MIRYANDLAIKRKAKTGKILTLAGFGIVIGSLILSVRENQYANSLLIVAFVATIIIQIGFALTNRWGKSPRTDELIDRALKGLDSSYSIFHFLLGANHVIFGPSGGFILVPSHDQGEINFRDGKWWQTVRRRRKTKQKTLKNLTSEAAIEVRATERALRKVLTDGESTNLKPLLVFMHPQAVIHATDANPQGVHYKKLKSFIRKRRKGASVSQNKVLRIARNLGMGT
ncbi:MAG: hypothetical protein IIC78_09930 [Chloroflexi bacterium]|nr:hypothetical protein [Chloroflexota bacterium]